MTNLLESMTTSYRAQLKAAAPDSLSCFVEYMTPDEVPARHHEFFCEKLEKIAKREIPRATFSCPPGHAKTKFCSRYFSAWYLGKFPHHKYLQGGHSQKFAENEFGRYVRDIIMEPAYREVFPNVAVNPKSTAIGDWRLHGHRGGYVAKGAGQSIAGYRAHMGGIDDPFGSREDAQSEAIRNTVGNWLFTDFRTRLLPGAPLFIVATRWHPDDLIGRVEALSKQGLGKKWEIYNLPAIVETEDEMAMDPLGRSIGEPLWPEFYGLDELLELKASLPAGDWWALYKGQPRDAEGNVVKSVWFQRYRQLPTQIPAIGNGVEMPAPRLRRVTVSVDAAEKATARANPTVALVWMEDTQGNHYLADVLRRRMEFPEMTTAIEALARKWGAHAILVEEGGAGVQYIQTRSGLAPAPVIPIPTMGKDKEFRFDGVTPMFEAGQVWLPTRAPWLADYEAEILAFPNSTNDDQVDATSQYLAWARKRGFYGSRRLKGARRA